MRDQCPDLTVSARAAPLCGAHTGDNGSCAKICCLEKRGQIAYPYTRTTLTGPAKQGAHRSGTVLDIPAKSLCKGRRRASTSYVRLWPDVCVGDPAIQAS